VCSLVYSKQALEHLSASCLMIFCKANPQALKKLSGTHCCYVTENASE
jgi:hypothetical protein